MRARRRALAAGDVRSRRRDHDGLRGQLPVLPGRRSEDWLLEDPTGLSIERARAIRGRVERLLGELLG